MPGLFHLACSQCLSMLYHVSNFVSLRLNNIPLLDIPHFIHSSFPASRLLCCERVSTHLSLSLFTFSSGKVFRDPAHVSHHSCIIWYPHQQHSKVLISPTSCQHSRSLFFRIVFGCTEFVTARAVWLWYAGFSCKAQAHKYTAFSCYDTGLVAL